MNFEEWNKETDSLCPRRAFDVAFNYQQAKIDILQIKLNGADERAAAVLNHKNKMIDELQARVNEALSVLINMKQYGVDEAIYILKGNKDEN